MKTQFGPFVFDRAHQLLAREGQEVPLPPRVLGVLDVLTARPGQIVSRQELIETVWKDAFVSDTSLAEAISFLRQALGDDPQQPSYIQTVHRRGYRFLPSAPAQVTADAPAPIAVAARDTLAQLLPWALVVLLAAIAGAAVWRLAHPDAALVLPTARFEIPLPQGVTIDTAAPAVALSADGSRIVFTGCTEEGCRLFTRALADTAPALPIAGTDGASAPFVSPDGTVVGFFAEGKLKRIPAAGGSPTTIADVRQPLGAAWADDGSILFAGTTKGGLGGLSRVAAEGGSAREVSEADARGGEVALAWPETLPGGGAALATAIMAPGDAPRTRIVGISYTTGQRTVLIDGASFARFVPPSTVVFVRAGSLMAAAFDPIELRIVGQPVALGAKTNDLAPQLAVSRFGSLVAALGATDRDRAALAWIAGDGVVAPLPSSLQRLASVSLSADGRRLAAIVTDDARADVWSADVERGAVTRVTFDGEQIAPVSSADGRTVVYGRRTSGVFNVFSRALDAPEPRRLTSSPHHQTPDSVSADAHTVAFTDYDPATGEDIWTVPLDAHGTDGAHAGGQPVPFVKTPYDEEAAAFSPDGRWLAYQSNESNRWEVYVRPYPGGGAATVLSAGGGTRPSWSRDGRTLFYTAPSGVMAVDVRAECGNATEACDISASKPRQIVAGPWSAHGVGADGRLLVERLPGAAPADRLVVTLQWTRELQRLVPPAVVASPK